VERPVSKHRRSEAAEHVIVKRLNRGVHRCFLAFVFFSFSPFTV
jgi:hypothetical protein